MNMFDDNYETPLTDFDCDELEKQYFSTEFIKIFKEKYEILEKEIFNETDKLEDNKINAVVRLLYKYSSSADKLSNMINSSKKQTKLLGLEDPFEPTLISEDYKMNLSAYILFGLWKTGLICSKNTCSYIETLYLKYREFFKNYGMNSYSNFLSAVCIGIIKADSFYLNNMNSIVEDHITYLENEMNNDIDITL